jgi:hypothetical protein
MASISCTTAAAYINKENQKEEAHFGSPDQISREFTSS